MSSNSDIQAILFDKEVWSIPGATHWLKNHDLHPIKKVHIIDRYYRYRLKEPNSNAYKYRIKKLAHGISAVIQFV